MRVVGEGGRRTLSRLLVEISPEELLALQELLELLGHDPHEEVVVSELTQNDNDQIQTES